MTATQELALRLDPYVAVHLTELGALGYRSYHPSGGWERLSVLVDRYGWERVAGVADVARLLERLGGVAA